MGADIHLWVETQSDESWRFANCYRIERWEKESWIDWDQPYIGRNYRLFALLADVRNFEPRLTPIASPRGVPLDCSKIGRRIIDEWGADGHDHSWLFVEELLQRPWTESHRAMVGDFATEFLPRLEAYGPADRTRIVFFFDN